MPPVKVKDANPKDVMAVEEGVTKRAESKELKAQEYKVAVRIRSVYCSARVLM
jgi:hypothetical protein